MTWGDLQTERGQQKIGVPLYFDKVQENTERRIVLKHYKGREQHLMIEEQRKTCRRSMAIWRFAEPQPADVESGHPTLQKAVYLPLPFCGKWQIELTLES